MHKHNSKSSCKILDWIDFLSDKKINFILNESEKKQVKQFSDIAAKKIVLAIKFDHNVLAIKS